MTGWETYLQFFNAGATFVLVGLIWYTSRTYRKTYESMCERLDLNRRETLWWVYRSLSDTGQIVLPPFAQWTDPGNMTLPEMKDGRNDT